ncbi:hypothetical protein LCI18_000686 [Fusarium solani-melongenae]|uniref:Uncharacterized protein n=1 Tax=Fusarium solani subsp. cucurbitae TaxID=2747967 RepID=A0ACD3YMC1_FUSSC|nr:hypothetical protein LCI18_000686 [Fusarium solani-melongenae]
MNSIPLAGHWEGESLWQWFDQEPELRVAILTGKGSKAFSAGADLVEQRDRAKTPRASAPSRFPPSGFLGVSRRAGKKPIIAAVNGYALGGGFETVLNCDLAIASPTASFGLPEVKRGLYAAAGGLPRIVRIFGMQLAGEIALTGRSFPAQELQQYGFLRVSSSPESLLDEAVQLAVEVASQSPDAVLITRSALREAWETASVERSAQLSEERWLEPLFRGENLRIGLEAFRRKEKPKWVQSKLS